MQTNNGIQQINSYILSRMMGIRRSISVSSEISYSAKKSNVSVYYSIEFAYPTRKVNTNRPVTNCPTTLHILNMSCKEKKCRSAREYLVDQRAGWYIHMITGFGKVFGDLMNKDTLRRYRGFQYSTANQHSRNHSLIADLNEGVKGI